MKRFLRSPAVIVAEMAAIAAACLAGVLIPQSDGPDPAGGTGTHPALPLLAALTRTLALDRVFSSGWFLAAVGLTFVSLLIVAIDQVRHLRRRQTRQILPETFRAAPFRAEFERAARGAGLPLPDAPRVRIWREQAAGDWGVPLIHVGLLLVILAGIGRFLFGAAAMVDLMEGETLAPVPEAWTVQRPGRLARPIQLAAPLALEAVDTRRYPGSGDLRSLSVRVGIAATNGMPARTAEIPVNRSLGLSGVRLFVGSDYGPAALTEWRGRDGAVETHATLLKQGPGRRFTAVLDGPDGQRAYLRVSDDPSGGRADRLDIRVMRGETLVAAGTARVGGTLALPAGGTLTLHGLPFWVRLHASRDPALGLMYAGFLLVMAGVVLFFGFVGAKACVVVTPAGPRERVFVALRPRRFAPLFEDRFRRLVSSEGGPEGA